MDETRLHQLYYLKNVLGLHSVVCPPAAATDLSSLDHHWREVWTRPCQLLVIGLAPEKSETPFMGARGELLQKIMQAMKIPWTEVSRVEWQPARQFATSTLHSAIHDHQPRDF